MSRRILNNLLPNRWPLLLAAWFAFAALSIAIAQDQEPVNPALRPPKGAQVAIVVF